MKSNGLSNRLNPLKTVFVTIAIVMWLPTLLSAQGGVLYVENDNVGIGISSPAAPLHLYKSDAGDLTFRVDNQGNTTTATFNFAVNQFGAFTVNNAATSGQEFSLRQRLDAAGTTMSVQGSVEGTQFISTSSRELKTDFAELDTSAVLNSLVNLPMTSWRYKNGTEDRHFGLMAEDFKEAFGLGDGEHISTVDADGVAIAAIQGLHEVVQDKETEIQTLRDSLNQAVIEKDAEIEELEKKIQELKVLVMALAESQASQHE